MLQALFCALVKFCNMLIDMILDTIISSIAWLIALLPSVPWQFQPLQWGDFGKLIGYFIPIADMLTHFTLMLVLVAVWFSVQHILRIVRAVK